MTHPGETRIGTADQVRELDRRATSEFGVPSDLLMESAGRTCADAAQELLGRSRGPVAIFCGPGNNGGDGLVIARTLFNRGVDVRPVLVGPFELRECLSADTAANLARLEALGVHLTSLPVSGADEPAAVGGALEGALEGAALIVDALFGTGLVRPLRPPYSTVVQRLAACGAPILAVDLPSGLQADTGERMGPVAHATVTVTFAVWKRGLIEGAGPSCAGRVRVAEIGIPRCLVEVLPELSACRAR
ncbi:NAD(P)H-hydrate epimerase [Engelhardtia mirabilis]|uniref:NAD(P)H-hydrate epimerase n=1 Tax=Engelhardtia mirabilis TaxID=2528011 RepID=A0A518BQP7_9BACT|nr:Bifunctional NAD(P)H-hydrate repair enzyme Nnr [Planctomycetes bacterium Pla133]QDV03627.1 Bifunctional NAD(P)H-hydrate repair enzyme Nnr [Planctomycetes bacterium Pla86]